MLSPSARTKALYTLNSLRLGLIRCLIAVLFLTPAVTSPVNLAAQEPQDPGAEVEVLRVSTDLIVFPVRVTDKNRRRVLNLSERDFVFTDEDRVTSAPYFAAGAERVAMVFALDESGSLREIIAQQRETALALFGKFRQDSRIAVLRFAEKPKLIVGFDGTTEAASSAFDFFAGHNRRTAIFDAAAAAVNTFRAIGPDPAERRIVVLISDGLDNASATRADTVIEAARASSVSFYVIHLPLFEPRGGRLAVRAATKGFRDLAEKTGGRYLLVGDSQSALSTRAPDLSLIFQAIEEDLKSQYLIGFYVGNEARDGKTHRVSISLAPATLRYSVGERGFERTHHFFVNLPPRKDLKTSPN
jgi:VWFA-related protein